MKQNEKKIRSVKFPCFLRKSFNEETSDSIMNQDHRAKTVSIDERVSPSKGHRLWETFQPQPNISELSPCHVPPVPLHSVEGIFAISFEDEVVGLEGILPKENENKVIEEVLHFRFHEVSNLLCQLLNLEPKEKLNRIHRTLKLRLTRVKAFLRRWKFG